MSLNIIIIMYKLKKKTLKMLIIYFRSMFYTNQGIFPLYCKAMTSQECD